jgi:hypothetical protein
MISQTYRRYLYLLFGLCGIAAAGGLVLVVWLEPLAGDLTRVGGYSENDFGWNGVEQQFSPPVAEPGSLDGEYAIVVIGDSFSVRTTPDRQTREGSFWTDFLANDTGVRLGVFDVGRTPVERFLASPAYRSHPPRLVILELVERTLLSRLGGPTTCPRPGPPIEALIDPMPEPPLPGGYRRALVPRSIEAAAGQAADYLKKAIRRRLLHQDTTATLRLPLSRSDLFSSRRPGDLLVFNEDLGKAGWSADDWRTIRCRLLRYQRDVTANGTTAFVFVLVPDKSTAYADYLPAAPWLIDAAEHLAEPPGINMPRLDVVLRASIAAGTRDVYLPNDSHWSTAGSRIVARTVLRYLRPGTPPTPLMTGNGDTTASR